MKLLKIILVGTFMYYTISISIAQKIIVNSTFKPLSYEELARPVRYATERRRVSYADFEENFTKSLQQLQQKNGYLAKFYIERCIKINHIYNDTFYDDKELLYIRGLSFILIEDFTSAHKIFKNIYLSNSRIKDKAYKAMVYSANQITKNLGKSNL